MGECAVIVEEAARLGVSPLQVSREPLAAHGRAAGLEAEKVTAAGFAGGNFGLYALINQRTGMLVEGNNTGWTKFVIDLDEIEEWLN